MNKAHIVELLELSIELELKASELYRLFGELYPADQDFWYQLHIEERSHATLLRAALASFSNRGVLPTNMLSSSRADVQETIEEIQSLIDQCKASPLTRRDAFQIALKLEDESAEQHYNHFMGKAPESPIEEVYQKLNRQDKDHKERILNYFTSSPSESGQTEVSLV